MSGTPIQLYQVARDGELVGAYSREQIRILLSAGNLMLSDYYWMEGMPGWMPLTYLVGKGSANQSKGTGDTKQLGEEDDKRGAVALEASQEGPKERCSAWNHRTLKIALAIVGLIAMLLIDSKLEIMPWSRPPNAELVKRGNEAKKAKNYPVALKWYRMAAERGDAEGQVELGRCYRNGKGVAKDETEAFRLYRLAADQGFADAMSSLGVCYQLGLGVAKDIVEAVKLYRAATEQGSARGQTNLGKCYLNGTGLDEDKKRAVSLFRQAAEQGYAVAQNKLGVCYQRGVAVEKNEAEAVKWYRLAADQGDADGQWNLGVCYDRGLGVEKNITEAAKWYRLAADQEHAAAQYSLGLCYYYGTGVSQDFADAAKWYSLAGEQGIAGAQNSLAVCYNYGRGVARNPEEAVRWYRLAAEQGEVYAQTNLGMLYEEGTEVPQDGRTAVHWYRMAAEQNHAPAMAQLSSCYAEAMGVPKDLIEAVRWARRAAHQGNTYGQYLLAQHYRYGRGNLTKNNVLAHMFYNLAAAGGHSDAAREMKYLEEGSRHYLGAKWFIEPMSEAEIAEAVRLAKEFVPGKEIEEGPKPAPVEMAKTPATNTGTGFFVHTDGWLVTNAHVVSGSSKLRVVTKDHTYNATMMKLDQDFDLALLKVEGQFSALPVTSTQDVRMGTAVMTIGFPITRLMGFSPKMARGEVAALSGIQDNKNFFQISAPVQPGNSGGALVDERGNVIGIVCSKLSIAAALAVADTIPENVNYAIKSDLLLEMIGRVTDSAIKLPDLHRTKLPVEDLAKMTEAASVMILAY